MAASSTASATVAAKNDGGLVFSRSALVVKEPTRTVAFYEKHFGFTLAHVEEGEGQTSYLMATLEDDKIAALPADRKSAEAAAFVLGHDGTFLQLIHNHGSESDDSFAVNNGNVEPHRGFGHIAVSVPDVYAFCAELEKAGVAFRKKPDEGRMKGLAFALCPDGYWIEIIRRTSADLPGLGARPAFAQTMLRVAEVKESLAFFTERLGMTLLSERHFGPERGDFSLYFLASLPSGAEIPAPSTEESKAWMTTRNLCVVELTHNHGTEDDAAFRYHNGSDPALPGFSHVGFTAASAAAVPAEKLATPRDGYVVTVQPRA